MTESGYYPPGAEYNPNAPWNEKPQPKKLIPVTISITMSRPAYIYVDDYKILATGTDEDGAYFEDIDYSDCNLIKAVNEQIELPHTQDCMEWNVDEMEVVLE